MKKIVLTLIISTSFGLAQAQDAYRTGFQNTADNKIEILAGSNQVVIIGHDQNEIIIESDFKGNGAAAAIEQSKPSPERAKGLKPLSASNAGNTNIGLTVDKSATTFTVLNISQAGLENKYIYRIPNKVKLEIADMSPMNPTNYDIRNFNGEINLNSLNSQLKLSGITGPVVGQTTNGSIEIIYSDLAPGKPNSLTSVNGFIDITLPANVKIDLKLNTVNGEAYTDFEVKTDNSMQTAPSIPHFQMFNLEGELNGGGAPFSISTVNGDVYLRKKK